MARVDEAVTDHLEVIRAIEPAVEDNLDLLRPARQSLAAHRLPAGSRGRELARRGRGLPAARPTAISDELLVVLVGDMVTEEALPSYSVVAQRPGRATTKGTSPAPWARWLRGWTAEENRHGDLLNAYLRLTGRVDMRAVERTVHDLDRQRLQPAEAANDPYNLLVYTSFQERATRLSHSNVGRIAGREGDANLARICG